MVCLLKEMFDGGKQQYNFINQGSFGNRFLNNSWAVGTPALTSSIDVVLILSIRERHY